jgi:ABC-type amino acid transport system permease subunit
MMSRREARDSREARTTPTCESALFHGATLEIASRDAALEAAVAQRAVLRNQLNVALAALKEIDETRHSRIPAASITTSAYVTAIVRGALISVQQLQDEADYPA